MQDRTNTILGWGLFAGIVMLGTSMVAGEVFKGHAPHEGGYPVADSEGSEGATAEAEKPIAFYLASGDAMKGEQVFKKCAACHNADQGGANALGPNLWGVMGEAVGTGHGGFAFSDALKSHGGTWDWETMSAWLTSPKKFAPGTKMTFAGLSNPQDRADIMLFMNGRGGKLTVPPPPTVDTPAPDVKVEGGAEAEAIQADAVKAD